MSVRIQYHTLAIYYVMRLWSFENHRFASYNIETLSNLVCHYGIIKRKVNHHWRKFYRAIFKNRDYVISLKLWKVSTYTLFNYYVCVFGQQTFSNQCFLFLFFTKYFCQVFFYCVFVTTRDIFILFLELVQMIFRPEHFQLILLGIFKDFSWAIAI